MKLDTQNVDSQVSLYTSARPLYVAFAERLNELLNSLMMFNGLKIQVIESRAKEVDSFREKITRPEKSYENPMNDISDLCGARIIVYYSDDIMKVAEVISKEFDVIEQELSHQPDAFDADRFGYLSAHYVVKLKADRARLAEWNFAESYRAEIQVRTVIQHAWSAVSHALQYKQETAIPTKIRRRLFRIAGLFELADEEFVAIRNAKSELILAAASAFAEGNLNIPITIESLATLVDSITPESEFLAQANAAGMHVAEVNEVQTAYAEIYEAASRLKITSIGQIEELLKADNTPVFNAVNEFEGGNYRPSVDYVLFFVMISQRKNLMTAREIEEYGWSDDRAEMMTSLYKSKV